MFNIDWMRRGHVVTLFTCSIDCSPLALKAGGCEVNIVTLVHLLISVTFLFFRCVS